MKHIPTNAKKVFEGIFFSVWQWEQELYDGTTKTFEKASRPDVSTIIPITKDNKIVFIEEEQPTEPKCFSFPSGVVDEGETPDDCAKRELQEETGYISENIIPWFSEIAGGRVASEYHVYIAKDCELNGGQSLDPGERITVHLFTFEELLEQIEKVPFKNFSLTPKLIKAKYNAEYRQELQELLFAQK